MSHMKYSFAMSLLLCVGLAVPAHMSAQAPAAPEKYKPKNGVLNLKAILFGGGYRVTTVIPLHGNFSHYAHLEIVQAESLIGKDAPLDFLEKLATQLKTDFEKGGRFRGVALVGSFKPTPKAGTASAGNDEEEFRKSDSLDSSLRNVEDMNKFDRERLAAQKTLQPIDGDTSAFGTLVIRSQVIDYSKGNKILQLSETGFGDSILTIRFSYYDKETGEELGRSIISADNSSKVLPAALSPRTVMSGVAEGLVDQITRRQVAAER